MPDLQQVLELLGSLTPTQVVIGLVIVTGSLLVLDERRLALVPLLAQYVLLGLLLGPRLYYPLGLIRIGLGVAVCLVLYLSAARVQRLRLSHRGRPAEEQSLEESQSADAPSRRDILPSTGAVFPLVVLALGSLMAIGVWRTFELPLVSPEMMLTSCWLICIGALLTLTSADPLRMGLGLLTCVNGFESIYLFLEKSLVVTGLLGVINIVIALSIVVVAESWLDSLQEARP